MRLRIIVADRSEARFYDTQDADSRLKPAGEIVDPQAHLHDRDFNSDRPGRVANQAARHSVGGENTPRRHEAEIFARKIADVLEVARREDHFDALVLMAGPSFLGVLREALPPSLHKLMRAEVNKDLVHQDEQAVRAHVPQEVFKKHL